MQKLMTFLILIALCAYSCGTEQSTEDTTSDQTPVEDTRIPVIFDTDANNELDDQHALAYLLFNSDVFNTLGITVNRTFNGGGIDKHMAEAKRVNQVCNSSIPIYKGADSSFDTIRTTLTEANFDGAAAVDFMIAEARKDWGQPLLLLPVGKLTNVALALEKAPDIAPRVRILWLGSNYPEPGEYNQDNDTASLNYILDQDVVFEMAMVRYGKPSGTDAVKITPAEVEANLKGKGPKVETAIEGRHGGTFNTFGDYAYDLFQHAEMYGDPPARALFDMAAVAIAKNVDWAAAKTVPAPKLVENAWVERPENSRKVVIWENFNRDAIINDFYESLNNPALPE
jgi:inosine-uridine nucleoside N-ribohydrolase